MSIICTICFSSFKIEDSSPPVVLKQCSHVFHQTCIEKCLKACQNKCPLCRTVSTKEIPLFTQLHLSYSPTEIIISNLLKEIDDLNRQQTVMRLKFESDILAINSNLLKLERDLLTERIRSIKLREKVKENALQAIDLCSKIKE